MLRHPYLESVNCNKFWRCRGSYIFLTAFVSISSQKPAGVKILNVCFLLSHGLCKLVTFFWIVLMIVLSQYTTSTSQSWEVNLKSEVDCWSWLLQVCFSLFCTVSALTVFSFLIAHALSPSPYPRRPYNFEWWPEESLT